MKFEYIAEYLEKEIPDLKIGSTMFIGQIPVGAEFAVMLKESFAGTEIDPELIGRRRGKFQAVVRGKNHENCRAMIMAISDALHFRFKEVGEIYVQAVRPVSEPVSYMLSIGNMFEFSVNFSIIYDIVQK